MQNTGIEMNAFFRIIEGRSFKWDIQANLSKVKNEIMALNGDKLISQVEGAEIVNQVGSAANSFYGYIFKGVYHSAEEAKTANLRNDKFVNYSAGDAILLIYQVRTELLMELLTSTIRPVLVRQCPIFTAACKIPLHIKNGH